MRSINVVRSQLCVSGDFILLLVAAQRILFLRGRTQERKSRLHRLYLRKLSDNITFMLSFLQLCSSSAKISMFFFQISLQIPSSCIFSSVCETGMELSCTHLPAGHCKVQVLVIQIVHSTSPIFRIQRKKKTLINPYSTY